MCFSELKRGRLNSFSSTALLPMPVQYTKNDVAWFFKKYWPLGNSYVISCSFYCHSGLFVFNSRYTFDTQIAILLTGPCLNIERETRGKGSIEEDEMAF